MDVLFHLGMGKTGTTSIQRALASSSTALKREDAEYLGTWFDVLGPDYADHAGFARILKLDAGQKRDLAGKFVDRLQVRGASKYIFSNEAIGANHRGCREFVAGLMNDDRINLSAVFYVRPVEEWLPSAYKQWGIRHKRYRGAVRSFAEVAPTLVRDYNSFFAWQEMLGDSLVVRSYDSKTDVVEDFSTFINIELGQPARRYLDSSNEAELALRAIFNDGYPGAVRPNVFNAVLGLGPAQPIRKLNEIVERCLDFSSLESVLESESELVSRVSAAIEHAPEGTKPTRPNTAAIREGVVDHLIAIVFRQAHRITQAEERISALQDALAHPPNAGAEDQ